MLKQLVAVAALLLLRCGALQVQPLATRRVFLERAAAGALIAVVPPPAVHARSEAEIQLKTGKSQSEDLKGMLGSFSTQLAETEAAKEQQKIEDAKPLTDKLAGGLKKAVGPDKKPSSRPAQVTVVPTKRKSTAPKRIGDGTL